MNLAIGPAVVAGAGRGRRARAWVRAWGARPGSRWS